MPPVPACTPHRPKPAGLAGFGYLLSQLRNVAPGGGRDGGRAGPDGVPAQTHRFSRAGEASQQAFPPYPPVRGGSPSLGRSSRKTSQGRGRQPMIHTRRVACFPDSYRGVSGGPVPDQGSSLGQALHRTSGGASRPGYEREPVAPAAGESREAAVGVFLRTGNIPRQGEEGDDPRKRSRRPAPNRSPRARARSPLPLGGSPDR